MTIDYTYFKEKLEEEKKLVENELEKVGRKNPDNPSDWQATPPEESNGSADENEAADKIEDYEENVAIVGALESRYNDIKDALNRIESGKYGICEVGGEEIEKDRLEANPSAKTCKAHMQ